MAPSILHWEPKKTKFEVFIFLLCLRFLSFLNMKTLHGPFNLVISHHLGFFKSSLSKNL